jgi:hypothetical protein
MAALKVSETRTPFITTSMAIGLVLVSALSLLTFLVLSAYAPELREESSAGGNALSKSAVGYAGLRLLLEDIGMPVALSRDPMACANCSFVLLAPEIYSPARDINDFAQSGPFLILNPKMNNIPNPSRPRMVN